MKRRLDLDVLRVASMLGVIYLHTAASAVRQLDDPALWGFSNVLVSLLTPAVPLFFMMSGALLLRRDRRVEWRDVLCRRVPRLLVPLLAWSGLILAYNFIRGDTAQTLERLKNLLSTPVMVPYWFLYALIPIYLLTPMLKAMTDHLSPSGWNYMMALWLVLTVGLSTLRAFAPEGWQTVFTVHYTLNINVVGGYLGYFLLGAWLDRLEKPPSKPALAAGCGGTLAVIILGTAWDTYAHGAYSARFTDYLNIFTVLYSALLFILVKGCLDQREERGQILPRLANGSFGIYLAHAPVMIAMEKLWGRLGYPLGPETVLQQLVFYGAVTAICVVVVAVASHIPVVSYLVAGLRWRGPGRGEKEKPGQ